MRKLTDTLFGLFRILSIRWFLTFGFLAFIGVGALFHFLDSARHHRQVMQSDLREAKMSESQINAISESLSNLTAEMYRLVTIIFMISAPFIATAYSRGAEASAGKSSAKIKKRSLQENTR